MSVPLMWNVPQHPDVSNSALKQLAAKINVLVKWATFSTRTSTSKSLRRNDYLRNMNPIE